MKRTEGLEARYFRKLNRFTTVAVYLTTIMLAYLCLSSFISGAVSGSDTKKVMGMLISVFGSEELEPTSVKAYAEKKGGFRYDGDTAKVIVTVSPENAKSYPITYVSSKPEIVSVDDGILTYHKRGTAKITATVNCREKLAYSFEATSYGQNPSAQNKVSLKSTPRVGTSSAFIINDGKTSDKVATYSSSDESVVSVVGRTAYFIGSGTAVLRATFDDESFAEIPVSVSENPSFVHLKEIKFIDELTFLSGTEMPYNGLIASVLPENADKTFTVSSSNPDVIKTDGENLIMKDKGTSELTYTSVFDPTVKSTVSVTVDKVMPRTLEITCPDFVMVNATITLKAKHSPVEYPGDVIWTVKDGFGKINGNKLKAEFFGKITVRCQSTLNPELYAEKVIDVKLYSNFYSFVRKILGHFSLFALLGFGIWGCSFLLTNFVYSLVLSPGVCFICSALCEIFQACTPGRYFTIADVFINFFGTLTGSFIAIVCVGIFCLIYRLISKERFEKLKRSYSYISIKTVFGKRKK